ncbi:PEP-CTERM sorting domain-containing protein, partial [Acinetobacter baumannii]
GAFTLNQANALGFSGDPTVLMGLAEAGGNVDLVSLPVPEPATWATMAAGLGVLGLAAVAQKRRRVRA